jgi:hypothetical protein
LRENHDKAYRSPDFLRRSTSREQLCATFFTESRMEFRGSTNLYRKSGFGLHQLRNCSSLPDPRRGENDHLNLRDDTVENRYVFPGRESAYA